MRCTLFEYPKGYDGYMNCLDGMDRLLRNQQKKSWLFRDLNLN